LDSSNINKKYKTIQAIQLIQIVKTEERFLHQKGLIGKVTKRLDKGIKIVYLNNLKSIK